MASATWSRRRSASIARKPLSIGFEEIAADKIVRVELAGAGRADDAADDAGDDETVA